VTTRAYGFEAPPALAIAEGATAPNPGIVGVVVWSTVENRELFWSGTSWQAEGAALATVAPAALSAVSSAGSNPTLARDDHVHAHGVQSDPAMHAGATAAVNGFMSAADHVKLSSLGAGTLTSVGAADAGKVPLLGASGVVDATLMPATSGMSLSSVAGRSVLGIELQSSVYGKFAGELFAPRSWTNRTRKWQAQWGTNVPLLDGMGNAVTGGTATAVTQAVSVSSPSNPDFERSCRIHYAVPAAPTLSIVRDNMGPVYMGQTVASVKKFPCPFVSSFRLAFPGLQNRSRLFFGLAAAAALPSGSFYTTALYTGYGAMIGFVQASNANALSFIQTNGTKAVVTALVEPLNYKDLAYVVYDFVIHMGRTSDSNPPDSIGVAWRRWPNGGWTSQVIPADSSAWSIATPLYSTFAVGNDVSAGLVTGMDLVHMFLEHEG